MERDKDKRREEREITVKISEKVRSNHVINYLLKIPAVHIGWCVNIHIQFK